jgi:bacteriocin-like protein
MMTNEKMMALDFVELNDEELQEVMGGQQSLANQLLQIYNSIWPNNTAPIPSNTRPTQSYFPQYSPYNYWY